MKRAAVYSRSGSMSLITIVGIVHMRMRRVARRESMDAVIAKVGTMGDSRRPCNLDGQHGQQEQQ